MSEVEMDDLSVLDSLFERAENRVKQKPWMKTKQFILGTVENLPGIINACIASKRYAVDLETSGLDNRVFAMPDGAYQTVDRIAGVCLSPDGVTGYYIPLHHVRVVDGERIALACNIPIAIFDREFRRLIAATDKGLTRAVFHNAKFDQEFLQFNETGRPWGEWDMSQGWDCTQLLAYLRNPRSRTKQLKQLAKAPPDATFDHPVGGPGLGMEMFEIHELWGHEHKKDDFHYDFTSLNPEDETVIWYAASDAICTWLLFDVVAPPVLHPDTDGKSMENIYKIEKLAVSATRWMERCRIHIDKAKVLELIGIGMREWRDSVVEVYAAASEILGRNVMPPVYAALLEHYVDDGSQFLSSQFEVAEARVGKGNKSHKITKTLKDGKTKEYLAYYDVGAPQQLGIMFEEMNVPGLTYTEKSGQVATGKEELKRIIDDAGEDFPFMLKIKKFRSVDKALATNLYPMYNDSDPTDHTMRISFQGHKVDTGRYSTPAKEGSADEETRSRMSGWPMLNVQGTPNTNDKDRPVCALRLRECYTSRPVKAGAPPRFIVAIDFSGVELRLVTNLSREPKWLTEFFLCSGCKRTFDNTPRPPDESGFVSMTPYPPPPRCPSCGSDKIGDLHTLTAISIYGTDAPSKPEWKKLRGNAKAVNFALCYGGGGSAVVRAAGVDKNEGSRIKMAFDKTYSGLKRWWDGQHKFAREHKFVRTAFNRRYPVPDISDPDGFFRSKAERNSVNGPIQGTSADITKLAMGLIYKDMKRRGWLEKVKMVITMHDELVFEIDADIIEEAIPILVVLMNSNKLILQMNWPIPLTSDVEIGFDWTVPWALNEMKHKEVRFIGNKKAKKDSLPEGVDYDSLPCWPEVLRPWFAEARGETPPEPSTPTSTPVPSAPEAPQAASQAASQEAAPSAAPQAASEAPNSRVTAETGGDWTYRLRTDLSPKVAVDLASIIAKCRGGSHTLHLRTRNNEPITGWLEEAGLTGIKVHAHTFDVLARDKKL